MSTLAEGALQLSNLSHHYKAPDATRPVLAGIELKLRAGEITSLIGPSGCGKSTLLKIACGLLQPSEGEVFLGGQLQEPLGEVGYMPQNDLLIPSRTLLDNVLVGLEVAGVSKSEARTQARAQLPLFGLEGFEAAYPAELSGGMRQRAALLRTFLVERGTYVLDEPFGSLDALTRLSMHAWLTGIWKRSGAAILFTTHDLDESLFLSDRIYVMSARPGTIIEEVKLDKNRPSKLAEMARDPNIMEKKAHLIELLGATGKELPKR